MFYKNETKKREYIIVVYKMIKILKEGDYFGELGIMEQKKRSATIIANENAEVAVITKEDFMKVLENSQ